MDLDLYALYERSPETKRIRRLEHWSIRTDHHGPYLVGVVVKDSEPDFDLKKLRLTSTSHIQYRDGMVVITRSGSEYTLLTPAPGFSEKNLHDIPIKP